MTDPSSPTQCVTIAPGAASTAAASAGSSATLPTPPPAEAPATPCATPAARDGRPPPCPARGGGRGQVWDRAIAPERVHHIHVAGRGSTLRKLLPAASRARSAAGTCCICMTTTTPPTMLGARPGPNGDPADVSGCGPGDRSRTAGLAPSTRCSRRSGARDPPAELRPRPGAPAGNGLRSPAILFLGRLSARKGVPDLLAALARPAMASLAWSAVLAGDGPVEEFRAEAAALGLSGRVTMPGWLGEDESDASARRLTSWFCRRRRRVWPWRWSRGSRTASPS